MEDHPLRGALESAGRMEGDNLIVLDRQILTLLSLPMRNLHEVAAYKRLADVEDPVSNSKRRKMLTDEQVERLRRSVTNAENTRERALQKSSRLLGAGSGSVRVQLPDFVEGSSRLGQHA